MYITDCLCFYVNEGVRTNLAPPEMIPDFWNRVPSKDTAYKNKR